MKVSIFMKMKLNFSYSNKQSDRFIGFVEDIGDTLAFTILTHDTNRIIFRSEVRTAEDSKFINL